ncbi:Protein of unknown function [Azotobacter beijerinckii]|uniref:Bacteriophage protein n=1 Tax=Azotobacter beijerinckii TaxID=170623 RepID=A0A1H6VBJ3_9GAMM|nr:DUF2612 domain-containing protein [Azotobacter beijerinckii]SEI99177.1 Protein of unknown function [Azotobacter beijerinckii]
MGDISDYLGLVTSEHADKLKFMAMLQAALHPFVDANNTAAGLPDNFDLDIAIGAQLDVVGLWVGISRIVKTPISGVYFSLDVDGLGFDQGVWQGPYDPDSGVVSLDDDTYRTLIRAKIAANRWDGTVEQSRAILDLVFTNESLLFIQDNQDMTMTIGMSGKQPSAIFLSLLTGGYIPIKPAGVRVDYVITSQNNTPIFGFDMQNQYVSGFDNGAFGVPV